MLSVSNKSLCQSSLFKYPYLTPPKTENKPTAEGGKIHYRGRGINTSVLHRMEFKGCRAAEPGERNQNILTNSSKRTLQFPETAMPAQPSTEQPPDLTPSPEQPRGAGRAQHRLTCSGGAQPPSEHHSPALHRCLSGDFRGLLRTASRRATNLLLLRLVAPQG